MTTNSPFFYTNFFEDVGIFEDLFNKCENSWEVLPNIEAFIDGFGEIASNFGYEQIAKGVYVGRNVTIDDTAKILDKAIIGHNSTIGHAAFLRGNVLIDDNAHIGHATEVKHSVILSNTALAHLNYVGDSIVGRATNISGGATIANWRFDKKDVEIKNGEQRIPTQMEKMGGIIGDGCFIGVSAVINPGTILGRGCVVFPLVSVTGTYSDNSKIK